MAAWLLRRPLLIHEQNAVAGLTNRLLSSLASRVMEAFPGTFPATRHAKHTGNPVRAAITAVPEPRMRYGQRGGALRLLVIGGSLGALALNEAVPAALARLDSAQRPEVWHQAGKRNIDQARATYAQHGIEARLEPFIGDMASAFAWADVVVCRAGALTVAELAAAGVASVLVPYPYAVDDHQTANAHYLADSDAAVLLPQSELTPTRLAELLLELSRERLQAMAEAARRLARPEATSQVVKACLEAAHG